MARNLTSVRQLATGRTLAVGRSGSSTRSVVPNGPSPPLLNGYALVSGAGTAGANGTYTPRGTESGRAFYNLLGEPDNIGRDVITWDGFQWQILLADSSGGYNNDSEDVADPWDSALWNPIDGASPAPTVTEV